MELRYIRCVPKLGPEDVSLLERCPHFRGCYVQASMELGPEDVSLLERCPHFRGCYVQASMELGPEDVSLLERCPLFRHIHVFPIPQTKKLRPKCSAGSPSDLAQSPDKSKVGGASVRGESGEGGGGEGGSRSSKKRKKKMQKVNPAAMLGFTVNAAERPNMGEIQSAKDAS